MLIQLNFKSEHVWLSLLSVNDDREPVVGRVLEPSIQSQVDVWTEDTDSDWRYI